MKLTRFLLAGLIGLLVNITVAQQVDSPKPQKLRVSEGVMLGRLIRGVLPEYPEDLRAKRIFGSVVLSLQIDKAGHVVQAIAVNGPPMMCETAITAVKQWQFKPYLYLNGDPVEVETTATFYFSPDQPINLHLSQSIMEGNLIHKVDPEYPQMAKIAHIQDDVLLSTVIDKQGDTKNLRGISGHPILIQAALHAVRQWKYKPFLLNGEPVEVETTITVRFHM
jgi:TonB family protein